jgi:hypothetical protein
LLHFSLVAKLFIHNKGILLLWIGTCSGLLEVRFQKLGLAQLFVRQRFVTAVIALYRQCLMRAFALDDSLQLIQMLQLTKHAVDWNHANAKLRRDLPHATLALG